MSPDVPRPKPASDSSDLRADRVAAAVKEWQRTLVDLGGRNTLLWYRDLATGTLDLTHAHPGGLSMLLAGRPTKLSDVVREPAALEDAKRRARAIRAKSRELHDERGIVAGFMAIGLASWTVERSPRPPAAPVILRTCELRPVSPAMDDFIIDLGESVEVNPVLLEYLRSEQGIALDAGELAELATVNGSFNPEPLYASLRRACARVPDFSIHPSLIVGTFAYTKLPMVADLTVQADSLADHDIIAALAGDPDALKSVRSDLPDPSVDPDPEREHFVLDADASQAGAIEAALLGAHLVVHGPPGTGKSQTIANLIAALAAQGKTTLFVAEKRAAIEAVTNRLAAVGLGDLVLDAYDGVTNRRKFARTFTAALDAGVDIVERRTTDASRALKNRRAELVDHVEAMHATHQPWGVSLHEVQTAIVGLTDGHDAPRSTVRLPHDQLVALDRASIAVLGRKLREVVALGAWTDEEDPWFGARISTAEDAGKALDIVSRLSGSGLEQAQRRTENILSASQVPPGKSVRHWVNALETMSSVRHTLNVFRPEVFDSPLSEAIAATATRSWRIEHDSKLGMFARARARRQAERLLRPGPPPANLHEELVRAAAQRERWSTLVGAGGRPEISSEVDEGLAELTVLRADLDWLGTRLPGVERTSPPGRDLLSMRITDLQALLSRLAANPDRLAVLPAVTDALDALSSAGLGPLVTDLAERGVPAGQVHEELEFVWWASLSQDIAVRDRRYGAHDGDTLRDNVAAYVAADQHYLSLSGERVRAAVGRRMREVLREHQDQEALIRAEGGKARRHRSLREMMPRAGASLTAIKPCWAMSPLVVASALPPGKWFDVVIFDEASQVPPAQAISAISRARQVVVAGDDRQLPPTNFFVSAHEEESDGDTFTEGFESLLDVLTAALPVRRLNWHYRSLDERLIAFANTAMYDGSLVTFPGASSESAISFVPVEGTAMLVPGADSVETTDAEVDAVVQLVLAHARTRPTESLGVIALGIRHADRLTEALRRALVSNADVRDFFAESRPEPFFVKNLERVQGDERDAIILSIGFGKTIHGRVLHRFGPLNLDGGERRLNVAITRARRRMTVVSALRATDLQPERLKARGAQLLRDFLAYAESGGDAVVLSPPPAEDGTSADVDPGQEVSDLAGEGEGEVPVLVEPPAADLTVNDEPHPDPLVRDLAARLRRHGLTVAESAGRGEQRIDLTVVANSRGRVAVAVESDGPGYAAIRNTRDRDRLRGEHLERLGWTRMQVWSTDLYRRPEDEAARLAALIEGLEPLNATATPGDTPVPPSADSHDDATEPAEGATQGEHSEQATSEGAESDTLFDLPEEQKARRRLFARRDRTLDKASDDTDLGWGELPETNRSHDQWLQEQRPPHWE